MPMKELKFENQDALTIERLLHAKHYALTLDKNKCVGCEICKIICPREAIEIKKRSKMQGKTAERPIFDVSTQKCSFCGMCESMCPFNALQVSINGEHIVSVVEKGSFPQLIHEIEVDSSKCGVECVECEKACPLNLIKVNLLSDGKEIPRSEVASYKDINNLNIQVDIKKNESPCCRLCEYKCPEGAIHVRKIFHGLLNIDLQKCPPDCHDCLDVCPIPGALFLESDGKVHPNETFCVFCGACKIACPVEGALTMERRSVNHTPIKSGAWNKAIEKLTSAREYSKESQTKRALKVFQSIEKRTGGKGEENA
jgi:4Fe-4S ferredoxin